MVSSRDEIIIKNTPLVHSVANRFRGRGVDYEDLFQAGCIGLIKAVDNFDESKGFKFSTYAVPVIMGEIKRLFRDGGSIKISRSLKEKSNRVMYARDKFMNKEEREPTVSELSALTGYSVEELPEILNVITPVMSLSAYGEEGEPELDIPVDDSDRLYDRLDLLRALSVLEKNEKRLFTYRFCEGKTQTQTAALLGISQVQVSRRERALLLKMRKLLE